MKKSIFFVWYGFTENNIILLLYLRLYFLNSRNSELPCFCYLGPVLYTLFLLIILFVPLLFFLFLSIPILSFFSFRSFPTQLNYFTILVKSYSFTFIFFPTRSFSPFPFVPFLNNPSK